MTTRDAMQFINEQDEATLDRFVRRLEFRGTGPTFVAYREAYLELLDLPRTRTVLDLGCGTGVVARALVARDERVEAWLADERRSSEEATFFASCNYYAYVAVKR